MKALMLSLLWICYVIYAPIFVIYSIIIITWSLYHNVRDFGELDFKGSISACYEGIKYGHYINKARIEELYQ